MRSMLLRCAVPIVALIAFGGSMTACSSDSTSGQPVEPTTEVGVGADVTVIDVRTPEEFAEGHLEGAVNLNVEDGTLQQALADFDPAAAYIVYCRSGRRSAIAAEQMAAAGFSSVQDLGALDAAAAATGLPIVAG